jgi:hypothetical protein
LSQRFEQELREFEENLNMPYVTSVERIAEARGEARGGVSLLLRQLAKVCGCLPEDVTNRIRSLPFQQIEEMGVFGWAINSPPTARYVSVRNTCSIFGRWLICRTGWVQATIPPSEAVRGPASSEGKRHQITYRSTNGRDSAQRPPPNRYRQLGLERVKEPSYAI